MSAGMEEIWFSVNLCLEGKSWCLSSKREVSILKANAFCCGISLVHEYTVSHIHLFLSILDLLYQAFLQDYKEKMFPFPIYSINGRGSGHLMTRLQEHVFRSKSTQDRAAS